LSDTYTFPHLTYFDSPEDLVTKLLAADLPAISLRMREHSLTADR
jgi:hypothetical protein